ncbi:response regulator transcription factor [Malaciobacter halophilus]|uniref:response regulator transcription factor n=1 Tax=Malaciobacter halophilus TaxID=197482 RepID=UPI001F2EABA1|nr:response regulator transcription factor [Malaciobacter halophilus]
MLEDNKRLSNLIIESLEERNYHVDWFENGKDAINAIFDGYDCFILDINVPGIDGISLLKEIKSVYSSTPCIIISANVELDTIKDAYTKGCDEYLKKPFFVYELETKLDRLCITEEAIIKLSEDYSYDIIKQKLFDKHMQEIKLSKKEILLMNLFAKYKDRVITFEHIEQYVWQGDLTTNDNIRALIKRVRKKLPKDTIISQGGVGYKLNIN